MGTLLQTATQLLLELSQLESELQIAARSALTGHHKARGLVRVMETNQRKAGQAVLEHYRDDAP